MNQIIVSGYFFVQGTPRYVELTAVSNQPEIGAVFANAVLIDNSRFFCLKFTTRICNTFATAPYNTTKTDQSRNQPVEQSQGLLDAECQNKTVIVGSTFGDGSGF
jgi:hypothetical protein